MLVVIEPGLPILFVGHLRKEPLITNLKRAVHHNSHVYIFIDRSDSLVTQSELLMQVDSLKSKHKNISVMISDKRMGVSKALPYAVNWLFTHEKIGIICEDDVTISNEFSNFFKLIETRFLESSHVMVAAMRIPVGPPITLSVRYPLIWGWATTREKWEIIEPFISKPHLKIPLVGSLGLNCFSISSILNLRRHPENSWALPIAVSMRGLDLRCLVPPVNYAMNTGNDVYASHKTNQVQKLLSTISEIDINELNEDYPTEISLDLEKWIETKVYNIGWKNIFGLIRNLFVFLKYTLNKKF